MIEPPVTKLSVQCSGESRVSPVTHPPPTAGPDGCGQGLVRMVYFWQPCNYLSRARAWLPKGVSRNLLPWPPQPHFPVPAEGPGFQKPLETPTPAGSALTACSTPVPSYSIAAQRAALRPRWLGDKHVPDPERASWRPCPPTSELLETSLVNAAPSLPPGAPGSHRFRGQAWSSGHICAPPPPIPSLKNLLWCWV